MTAKDELGLLPLGVKKGNHPVGDAATGETFVEIPDTACSRLWAEAFVIEKGIEMCKVRIQLLQTSG